MKKPKVEIIDEEVRFEDVNPSGRPVVSQTDLKGIITYTNSVFRALSGYEKGEMVGRSHNIVRHPDMPKSVFKDMWDTIQRGETWKGVVKNLRKDGRYYWVEAVITPIFDDDGNIIGYSSARKGVSDDTKAFYEVKYKEMREKELQKEKK
ncbi:MAG: PAS domain-containing protein [Nautiliaceae bacterium]